MAYDPEIARAFRESVITWRKDERAAMVAHAFAERIVDEVLLPYAATSPKIPPRP